MPLLEELELVDELELDEELDELEEELDELDELEELDEELELALDEFEDELELDDELDEPSLRGDSPPQATNAKQTKAQKLIFARVNPKCLVKFDIILDFPPNVGRSSIFGMKIDRSISTVVGHKI